MFFSLKTDLEKRSALFPATSTRKRGKREIAALRSRSNRTRRAATMAGVPRDLASEGAYRPPRAARHATAEPRRRLLFEGRSPELTLVPPLSRPLPSPTRARRCAAVVILDYGSQYTQLITRRCRELSIFSEVVPGDTDLVGARRAPLVSSSSPEVVVLTLSPPLRAGEDRQGVPAGGDPVRRPKLRARRGRSQGP